MSLPQKQMKIVLMGLEKQGCELVPKKKGWFILFPNGSTTVVHLTASDHRAVMNFRSYVLKAGLQWPLDSIRAKKVA